MVKKKKLNITEDQRKKCNAIIHSHSALCGGVGTGMAQIPLADNAVITPIQIAMIIELGVVFNQNISKTIAQSILSGASASLIGRGASQVLFGWIPGVGNAINTATAAGLTEVIGWMAVDRFSKEKFYDDSIKENHTERNKETDTSSENKMQENEKPQDEYQDLKDKAELFINGEKTYSNNREEYDSILSQLEKVLRTLPSEHELRVLYNELCDLPFK